MAQSASPSSLFASGGPTGNPLVDNPALLANPYALYALLRGSNPVLRVPIPVETGAGVWLLTRHADADAVLRDKRFSARRDRADVVQLYRDQLPIAILEGPGGAGSMLMMDPPEHTRLRGLVSKAFTPRRVEELRPRVEALVDALLGEAIETGEVDLIHDVAEPLPAVVIAELLGVPTEDHRQFREWSSRLIENLPATGGGSAAETQKNLDVVLDYLRGIIADRRRALRDDLISALIEAQEERDALSDAELLSTAFLLLMAGHETTTNLIGNGTLALARHPEQWKRLREDPELVDNAVEEMLRYDSPVQGTVRVATEDCEIGGEAIAKGALVICGIGAANRDPEAHPDPDDFDISRPDIRHLSFGVGTHFCLGASLARLEGRAWFDALARRADRLELASDDFVYRPNPILRGLRKLPVRLG